MRFLGGPCTEEEVRSRLDREIANGESFDVQYWPVMIGGRFAGSCGLKPHEPEQGFFELGFHFRPQFWGAGYASEAAREVIRYAFEDRGMHALFAGHHPDNDTSRSLLARLGFTRLGTHFFARTGLDHPWYRRDR
jgi:RimJ/RimL family protein N-acetyltransferase